MKLERGKALPKPLMIDLTDYGAPGRKLILDSYKQDGVIYYSVRGTPPAHVPSPEEVETLAKAIQEALARLKKEKKRPSPTPPQPLPDPNPNPPLPQPAPG